ncbi:MAG TPA: hypothetical protein PL151_12915 [Phycisphaerae bacterium]|nr:hypothetical protein [Phycisphaerae bacterium]HOJ73671.1 hypothetical protein [Phycisphaerae bacterium]HOM50318.1 hypothetical protein [Phycisphaerae bacterium]HON65726.1 hypothetical protein [Phycisphaerae bacterium]HOQ87842.1 hypothetical protein [Phycisphaerae bacterium]
MDVRFFPVRFGFYSAILLVSCLVAGCQSSMPTVPRVAGEWWTVARNPDLGELNGPPEDEPHAKQQPVDFAVWQAADGPWQLWSCIRGTKCGGKSRLFYGWEGAKLTDADWTPKGIRMQADPGVMHRETLGGLQAPYVLRHAGEYLMFYGDWVHICMARSSDGKHFERCIAHTAPGTEARTGMFSEGPDANTRDAMVVRIDGVWHCYYTAHPGNAGAVYCRTSRDLKTWSDSTIVARGGSAGSGPYSGECPHVVFYRGYWYLFRTQNYAHPQTTRVYRSTDPMDFGIDTDDKLVAVLEVAAPEVIHHDGEWYMAALLPDLQGIRIARLEWVVDPASEVVSQPR